MTVAEASKRIGISASLVYELCRLGMIRHSRHGRPGKRGTIRLSDDAVGEYLLACERQGLEWREHEPLQHIHG
jgi:excisionase family DNA binding protein